MARIEKGIFLEIGRRGKEYETKIGIIKVQLMGVGIIVLMFLMGTIGAMGKAHIADSHILAAIIPYGIGIFTLWALLFLPGQEIDAIYENGLTHHKVGLLKKLQGKHWIPWEEIDKIEYGYIDSAYKGEPDISEYVRIYAGDRATWYFTKNSYGRHNPRFYPLLLKMLHERAPQAEWIRKDVTDFDTVRNREMAIPIPSCPSCGQPLTFIPEYGRWHCHNCEEYLPVNFEDWNYKKFKGVAMGPEQYAPTCPSCSRPLTFIPEYGRWYCYNCEEYAPETPEEESHPLPDYTRAPENG